MTGETEQLAPHPTPASGEEPPGPVAPWTRLALRAGEFGFVWRLLDPIAILVFAVACAVLLDLSHLNFWRTQDANWDLLNYHAYNPSALLSGRWFSDLHPASVQSYLTPYQDLLLWPLISSAPARMASVVIALVQTSIFIPIGLILRTLVPSLSRRQAWAIGLLAASGAVAVTELGGTMGDFPPAIAAAWGLWLLLSILGGASARPEARAALGGLLIGLAVALKLTTLFLAPGLLVIAIALFVAGYRRSAIVFVVAAPLAAAVLYAPWALILQTQDGSPTFPFYNAIFHAARYPAENFADARFSVQNLADLIGLSGQQALGTANTSEIPFRDARWQLALVAIVVGAVGVVLRRTLAFARKRDASNANLPALALSGFWLASYVTWAFMFGIQRYALLLEALTVPIVVSTAFVVLPRLPRVTTVLVALIFAGYVAQSTVPVDFGRLPVGPGPIIPSQTIEPLSQYDTVVIGSSPLAFLRAVTRDAPGAADQIWIGAPFNDADLTRAKDDLAAGNVGIVYYPSAHAQAEAVAKRLGLDLTDDCQTFSSPLPVTSATVVTVCTAVPSS